MPQLLFPQMLWLGLLPGIATIYFLIKPRKILYRVIPFPVELRTLEKLFQKTKLPFRLLFVAFVLAFFLLILAIARPFQVIQWSERIAEGIDIVIVLDVSESMLAEDLKPDRFMAAKEVIKQFIQERSNDRFGFVIFGGESVTKAPLTTDHDFILTQLEELRLRELKQGTAIGMGLANGINRLRTSDAKTKVIVLLTDGDSNVGAINPITAAELARQERIRVYTIGIGKDERVVVPIYSYDAFGNKSRLVAQVPSYINPELLANIAKMTGGRAYMARDNGMLIRVLQDISRLEKSKVTRRPLERKKELFAILGTIALIMLTIVCLLQETRFRRGQPLPCNFTG